MMVRHGSSRWITALRRACGGAFALALVAAGGAPARADAQAGLGLFQSGQFSEALQAWQQEAERGDATSALYLGVLYDTGFGVAQDYGKALGWYERGGTAGSVTAMLNAALMHDAGRGAPADPAAAAQWYGRAQERGSGRAAYNLAMLYDEGTGVARDRGQAIRLYRAAAKNGVPAARERLRALGVAYAVAVSPAKPDPAMVSFDRAQTLLLSRGAGQVTEAARLFRAAAEAGNSMAAYNLAYCYEHGLGVQQSGDEALSWYRRSADAAKDPTVRELSLAGARNVVASLSRAQR